MINGSISLEIGSLSEMLPKKIITSGSLLVDDYVWTNSTIRLNDERITVGLDQVKFNFTINMSDPSVFDAKLYVGGAPSSFQDL